MFKPKDTSSPTSVRPLSSVLRWRIAKQNDLGLVVGKIYQSESMPTNTAEHLAKIGNKQSDVVFYWCAVYIPGEETP